MGMQCEAVKAFIIHDDEGFLHLGNTAFVHLLAETLGLSPHPSGLTTTE